MASSSRLFIDLVHEACGLYLNPSPHSHIEVGDYGALNRETGYFEKAGSIYDDEFRPELKIKARHPVEVTQAEELFMISSRGMETQPFDEEFNREHPEIAACQLVRERWHVHEVKQAGFVVLYQPQEHFLSGTYTLLPELAETLKGKAIVTRVYICPSFATLIASRGDADIDIACGLREDHEAGQVQLTWHYSTSSPRNLWRSGGEDAAERTFSPLFALKQPKMLPTRKRILGIK